MFSYAANIASVWGVDSGLHEGLMLTSRGEYDTRQVIAYMTRFCSATYAVAFLVLTILGLSLRSGGVGALPFVVPPELIFLFILITSIDHFSGKRKVNLFAAFPALLGLVAFLAILSVGKPDVDVFTAGSFLALYGFSLFVILSDVLIAGGAARLTALRGKKWIKELDYLYLGLGALGIFGTLNRMDVLGGRILDIEFVGPIILTTALVVRLIKTRAEIGDWAGQTTNPSPASSPTSSPASSPPPSS
jgi:hypothetical protein